MKKIVLFVPNYFSNFILMMEQLNPFITSENDVLLCSETISVLQLVQKYAKEKNISVQHFQADWNQHSIRANEVRDREMMATADLLVVFNDGENEKMNFLKSLAIEKDILIREINITNLEAMPSTIYLESLQLKSMEELQIELEKLIAQKNNLIKEMKYEDATQIRLFERVLKQKIEETNKN
jgi:hypothetical protein